MKNIIKIGISVIQKIIVYIGFFFNSFFNNKKDQLWVVAGVEIASMLKTISDSIPNSVSVNFGENRFYDFTYTYSFGCRPFKFMLSLIHRPWLLGKLTTQRSNFLYIGGAGFLHFPEDGRDWEFRFLKSHGVKLVCYFTGSEIRSFDLLNQYSQENEIDVITTYQAYASPGIDSKKNEQYRRLLGVSADKYADFIFNPPIDQMAYISRPTLPYFYFVKREYFKQNIEKFNDLSKVIIVHGPSSPLIKGTPIVRAAIKKLKEEGYNFEYRELIGIPHKEMLRSLSEAHIVLNQFYAFVPGVLTMEALANYCAVLTSADPEIETSLPKNCKNAWKVTPYWKVYENLKSMLDDPVMIKNYADAGYKWALENCEEGNALESFLKIIQSPL